MLPDAARDPSSMTRRDSTRFRSTLDRTLMSLTQARDRFAFLLTRAGFSPSASGCLSWSGVCPAAVLLRHGPRGGIRPGCQRQPGTRPGAPRLGVPAVCTPTPTPPIPCHLPVPWAGQMMRPGQCEYHETNGGQRRPDRNRSVGASSATRRAGREPRQRRSSVVSERSSTGTAVVPSEAPEPPGRHELHADGPPPDPTGARKL